MATPSPCRGQGSSCLGPKSWEYQDYDNDAEEARAHLLLCTVLAKKGWGGSSQGPQGEAKVMGVESQDQEGTKVSTPPVTPAKVGRRSVLDNMKYGPGNRPYCGVKEGRVQSQYPDLLRALKKEPDPSRRRQIVDGHQAQIISSRK